MGSKLCIVGFGRLGETLATILAPRFKVSVIEIDAAKRERAHTLGYHIISQNEIRRFGIVIFCVPISHMSDALAELADYIAPGTVAMDACSVKVYPAQLMRKLLNDKIFIIGTHPMFGPDSIQSGLSNLSIVTCPVRVEPSIYDEWNDFWRDTGLRVIPTTPEAHDKITAYTLCMTHFFGRVMEEMKLKPQKITTMGYELLRDVTRRTAHDSWQLFYDMQRYNPYAKAMRRKFHAALSDVEERLAAGKGPEL